MHRILTITALICLTALATGAAAGNASAAPTVARQNGCIMI
ncbi:hypothetical protein [Streptomyces sp. NPDC059783]